MKFLPSGNIGVFSMSKIFGTIECSVDKAFSKSERFDSEEIDCETIMTLGVFRNTHSTARLLFFIQLSRTFFSCSVTWKALLLWDHITEFHFKFFAASITACEM